MKKLLNYLSKQDLVSLKSNKLKFNNIILNIIFKKLCLNFNIIYNRKTKLICSLISQKVSKNKQSLKSILKFKKSIFINLLTEVELVLNRTKFHYADRYGILVNLFVTKDGFQENLDKKHNQKTTINECKQNELQIKMFRPDISECFTSNRNPYQINQTKKFLIYTIFGNYYKLILELKASLPLICHRISSTKYSYKNFKHILPEELLYFVKKNLSNVKSVLFHQILKYGITIYQNNIIFCRDVDKVHRVHLIEKPNKNKSSLFFISSSFNRLSQLLIQTKIISTNSKLISLSSSKGITNNLCLILNHQSYYLNSLINKLSLIDFYKLKLMQYQHSCNPIIRLDRNGLKSNKSKSAICKLCFEAARKIYMEETIKNKCYKIENCLCSEMFFGSYCNFGTCYHITIEA